MDITDLSLLMQSQPVQSISSLSTAMISAIAAIFGTFVGGAITYCIERSKEKNNNLQRKQQVFSQLIGRKSLTEHLYISYYGTVIKRERSYALEYLYELRIKNSNYRLESESCLSKKEEEEFKNKELRSRQEDIKYEARQNKKRYEELELKIFENNLALWETIGLIQILFPNESEMIEKIRSIKYNIIEIDQKFDFTRGLTYEMNATQVQEWLRKNTEDHTENEIWRWSKETTEKVKKTVMQEIAEPLEQLINSIRTGFNHMAC